MSVGGNLRYLLSVFFKNKSKLWAVFLWRDIGYYSISSMKFFCKGRKHLSGPSCLSGHSCKNTSTNPVSYFSLLCISRPESSSKDLVVLHKACKLELSWRALLPFPNRNIWISYKKMAWSLILGDWFIYTLCTQVILGKKYSIQMKYE